MTQAKLDILTEEYCAWCTKHHYPHIAAEELHFALLGPDSEYANRPNIDDHKDWLLAFIDKWEEAA